MLTVPNSEMATLSCGGAGRCHCHLPSLFLHVQGEDGREAFQSSAQETSASCEILCICMTLLSLAF